jgi:hypothetical protein
VSASHERSGEQSRHSREEAGARCEPDGRAVLAVLFAGLLDGNCSGLEKAPGVRAADEAGVCAEAAGVRASSGMSASPRPGEDMLGSGAAAG